MPADSGPREAIERIFRRERAQILAVLIRLTGDFALAEDVLQEAFSRALERWPADGVPPSPAGWITTTARRRAIDILRRVPTTSPTGSTPFSPSSIWSSTRATPPPGTS